jgi:hypothetical protein
MWTIWDDTGKIKVDLTEKQARDWLYLYKDSSRAEEYYAEDESGRQIESWDSTVLD